MHHISSKSQAIAILLGAAQATFDEVSKTLSWEHWEAWRMIRRAVGHLEAQ